MLDFALLFVFAFHIPQLLSSSGICVTAAQVTPPLVDFQVAQPPPLPNDAKQCTVHILSRTFGNSFFHPEVVQYTPPLDCGDPGTWVGVTLNWTATSNGTQFDRLSAITFHNVEIWRTSTPEPTRTGIIWTYIKDVTRYIPLFSKPGTLILDLNNIVNQQINGEYNVNLSATFFASSRSHPPAPKSDVIIPISNLNTNMANYVSVPPDFSLNISFPRNSVQAYAELYASGNGNEEFWYSNVADEFMADLPAGAALGRGPFREVRLLVDGMLAGVAFPYPVFFTGADVPPAWRPITSYATLDLPTYFIDLTPFVPLLADGGPHNVSLDVVSAEANHTINDNWFVSGNIQVLVDHSTDKPTTGGITSHQVSPFATTSLHGSPAPNGDLNVTVLASRKLQIEAEVTTGSGETTHVVWQQNLQYENLQLYLLNATQQIVKQTSSGTTLSIHNGRSVVKEDFAFPVFVNLIQLPDNAGFTAFFDHSYERDLTPSPLITGTTIHSHQTANGSLLFLPNGTSTGTGMNNNTFSYSDLAGNTYTREVRAASNVITFDRQGGSLGPVSDSEGQSYVPDDSPVLFPWAARLPGGKQVSSVPPA